MDAVGLVDVGSLLHGTDAWENIPVRSSRKNAVQL